MKLSIFAASVALSLSLVSPTLAGEQATASFTCEETEQCNFEFKPPQCAQTGWVCGGSFAGAANDSNPADYVQILLGSNYADFTAYLAGRYYSCDTTGGIDPTWSYVASSRVPFEVEMNLSGECTSVEIDASSIYGWQ